MEVKESRIDTDVISNKRAIVEVRSGNTLATKTIC